MNFLQTHPIFFTLHGFQITAHGFFFALGAVIATIYLSNFAHEFDLRTSQVVDRALGIFVVGLLAARVGYLVAYPNSWDSALAFIAIWQGGLVSFTGIAGGLWMAHLYGRLMSANERQAWIQRIVLATLLGWTIGRIGNFYAGESGGVVSSVWSVTYGHVPIQLFESLGCLILFISLNLKKLSPRWTNIAGIGGYLVVRFFVDFWRDEHVIGLRVSQWFSLVGIVIIALYAYRSQDKK